MRVTINLPEELVLRLDDHIKNTFRNAKLRSYVVTRAIEEYLRTVKEEEEEEVDGKVSEGYFYILKLDHDRIKFGFTKNSFARLASCKVFIPDAQLLQKWASPQWLEQKAISFLGEKLVCLGGEVFLSSDMPGLIEKANQFFTKRNIEKLRRELEDSLTIQTEITGSKTGVGGRSPRYPPDVPVKLEILAQLQSDVPHSDDLKRKDTALIFNTVLGLYQAHDDISPGMIAAILKCSPVHVGAVLNHLGIQRIKRVSLSHPMAHFIVWDDELMRRLFEQYGHEEFQAQFPGAKPYYKKPLPETLF